MKIHKNTGGLAATHSYLVTDESANVAVLIDAPQDTITPLLKIARQNHCDVPFLLLTHAHWDHISDHLIYSEFFPQGKICLHKADEPKLQLPQSSIMQLPYSIQPRSADAYLTDGQIINVGAFRLEVLHTPGHASGHVCFYERQQATLFAGDLLFAGSVGRTDIPDADPIILAKSLERIMLLPDHVRVFPGHGPATTIGAERKTNPWIRGN